MISLGTHLATKLGFMVLTLSNLWVVNITLTKENSKKIQKYFQIQPGSPGLHPYTDLHHCIECNLQLSTEIFCLNKTHHL